MVENKAARNCFLLMLTLVFFVSCAKGQVGSAERDARKKGSSSSGEGVAISDAELEAALNDPNSSLDDLIRAVEPKPSSVWTPVFTLELGGGLKDNVALSPVRPETSPMLRSLIDLIYMRDNRDGLEGFLFASLEDIRFNDSEVDREQTGLLMAEFTKELESYWDLGWNAQYVYQKQVLDLSTDLTTPFALNVEGHTYLTQASAKRHITGRYWAEARMEVSRQDFSGPIDDYWDFSPRAEFAKWWPGGHTALSYTFSDRPYDTRGEPDDNGNQVRGTQLEFNVHRIQLEWQQDWGKDKAWRTTTRLQRDLYFDNGSGFFKYRRWRVSEKIRYRRGKWTVNGTFSWATFNYPAQPAVFGGEERRQRNDWNISLRINRSISKLWSGYLAWDYELSDSNQLASTYDATMVHAGFVFER